MPTRPPTPCRMQPCPRYALDRGKCAEHLHKARQQRAQDSGDAFYSSRPWRHYRKAFFIPRHPTCEGYPVVGACTQLTTQVDHRISRRERPDLAFDEDNCRGYCASCHSTRTAREQSGWRG